MGGREGVNEGRREKEWRGEGVERGEGREREGINEGGGGQVK